MLDGLALSTGGSQFYDLFGVLKTTDSAMLGPRARPETMLDRSVLQTKGSGIFQNGWHQLELRLYLVWGGVRSFGGQRHEPPGF